MRLCIASKHEGEKKSVKAIRDEKFESAEINFLITDLSFIGKWNLKLMQKQQTISFALLSSKLLGFIFLNCQPLNVHG